MLHSTLHCIIGATVYSRELILAMLNTTTINVSNYEEANCVGRSYIDIYVGGYNRNISDI